jgi:hypothetical protein
MTSEVKDGWGEHTPLSLPSPHLGWGGQKRSSSEQPGVRPLLLIPCTAGPFSCNHTTTDVSVMCSLGHSSQAGDQDSVCVELLRPGLFARPQQQPAPLGNRADSDLQTRDAGRSVRSGF